MRPRDARAVLCAVALASVTSINARADDAPSAERIRSAASEFDAGRRATNEKDYEGAAAHFENAFHDAPSAAALRAAVRARRKAGQLAHAATLANLATQRYPKDKATAALVRDVMSEARTKLSRLTVRSTEPCGVALDGRAISLEDAVETVFYVDPGEHALVVSWSGERGKTSTVTATAGGDESLSFEPPPPPAPATPSPPVVAEVPAPRAPSPVPVAVEPPAPKAGKALGPAVFITGAALTAAGLGVTVWSGLDATSNPGTAAVRRECVGLGTSCPAYQSGLAAQLRTNVLIGATAGVAAATAVVGIFFTEFHRKAASHPAPLQGGVAPLRSGAAFSLTGEF